jgi:hypothetical protein
MARVSIFYGRGRVFRYAAEARTSDSLVDRYELPQESFVIAEAMCSPQPSSRSIIGRIVAACSWVHATGQTCGPHSN